MTNEEKLDRILRAGLKVAVEMNRYDLAEKLEVVLLHHRHAKEPRPLVSLTGMTCRVPLNQVHIWTDGGARRAMMNRR